MSICYYPVYLNIENKKCLVVGGGAVGARKTSTLLEYKADVTVISPSFTNIFDKIKKQYSVKLVLKEYEKQDLKNMFLVIGATDNIKTNQVIMNDAESEKILCNIITTPEKSNFILPSIVKQGDLVLTVSTSGKSPAFARQIKQDLKLQFGKEYADFLFFMGELRKKLIKNNNNHIKNKKILEQLIEKNLLNMIKNKDYKNIDDILLELTGYKYKDILQGKNL